jgi:hypothetical protein
MTQAYNFMLFNLMGCYTNACRVNIILILVELGRTLIDDDVNPP